MQPEGQIVESLDQGILRLDRAIEVLVRILTSRAHPIERYLVNVSGESRCIDVDIAAAGLYEPRDHLPLDGNHVSDERVHVFIDRLGALPGEALGNAIRTDQADLDRILRERSGEPVLIEHDIALEREPLNDAAAGHNGRPRCIEVLLGAMQRTVWLAPIGEAFHVRGHVKSPHRRAEAFLEIPPPEFAVRDDGPPDRFLLANDIANCLVLGCTQLDLVDFAAGMALEGRAKRLRGNQAAVLVDTQACRINPGFQHGHDLAAPRRPQYSASPHNILIVIARASGRPSKNRSGSYTVTAEHAFTGCPPSRA